ncbi:DEAD/DEAH box helicase [Streptomyces griseorubiginosus]|uniref:DEAD/DEAH box helicase n=1 Tax=Streptomyces griseorubiginosus TaxID=67304 RepID=UPI0011408B5A|nr:DEAD/DEAH box helicase [Streptomyces griseorubiginosus]
MELREHQVQARAAIKAAAAAGERRMTVVAACGTGKTLIAQQAAQDLAAQGPVLVLMPTKALVTQTIRRWREAGRAGLVLGVCSLRQRQSGLSPGEAVMTRGARTIARALGVGGPVTVFATYGSLHHIQQAHEHYGLPPWELVIADEAHRTCSAFGDGWGTVHDDAAIPAKTRLYMTATPRIWGGEARPERQPFMERIPLATMDHREIFGPTVFELGMAKAIELGILADYQVIMPIVEDSDLHAILTARRPSTSAHHNGLRNAAVQVALLRAIFEHQLRRVLVFHNRVALAEAFAASLPTTALEVGDELRIESLWAHAIHSKQTGDWRRDLLDDFADPDRACAVLSNVRVLNEGVDMPDVDAVVFADPRYSVIDAIQAIGRGLRQPPGSGKKTTLIFPVYLHPGTDTADLLHSSAFANLITLLQALRSHDESFMDRIALPARSRSAVAARRAVHYAHPERAAQLARALGLEITLPAIGSWEQALTAVTRYRTDFGHLDVPVDYTDQDGFALGECVNNLRLRHFLGRLPDEHQRALDALGMPWIAPVQTFDSMLEHARAWAAEHGHLAVPVTADVGGHKLGAWLATQRRKAKTFRLAAAHHEALAALDPHWDASWMDWKRKYARAKALVRRSGWRFTTSSQHASREDRATMNWLYKQRLQFFRLQEGQQDLLLRLGVPPLPDGIYYDSYHDPERHAFYEGLAHLAAFLLREGHADVPRRHQEPLWGSDAARAQTFALGEWIHRCRKHPEVLTEEQRRALEALHMVWDPRLGRRTRPRPPR